MRQLMRSVFLGGANMPEFQNPNIVGNFLQSYYGAQDRTQAQADAVYQRQRQTVADDRASKQFDQTSQINQLALAKQKHDNLVNILGRATDEGSFQQGLQQAALPVEQGGLGLPPEQLSHLSFAKDYQRLKQEAGVVGEDLAIQLQKAQIGRERAGTALTNAQADAARNKPAGMPTKAPNGYQYVVDETGQPALQPIPGGPADPMNRPLTKEQTDAAGFFSRLRMADGRLSTPEVAKELMSGYNSTVAPIPLGIGNALVSETYQQGDQAKRDLINAQLRRESGAAIGSSEFSNADQQYVPTYGDKPAVLDQKNVARKLAIYNMAVAAGPQYKQDAEDARKAYIEAVRQQKENDAKRKAAGGKTDAPATDPSKWTVTKVGK